MTLVTVVIKKNGFTKNFLHQRTFFPQRKKSSKKEFYRNILIFFGFFGFFLDFYDFFFGFFLDFFGLFRFFLKLLRLLLKDTKVNNGHKKWPKIVQNSIISFFLCPKGKKSPLP